MLFNIISTLTLLPLVLSNPYGIPCILDGEPCPASSTCQPATPCGGLCLTTQVIPPVTPCTVGASSQPCGTSEICTPTEVCATPTAPPCGGQCLYTGPATTNISLPTKPCIIGGCDCADQAPGVICTQTETCNGFCSLSTSSASTCSVKPTTGLSSSTSKGSSTITKPPTTTTKASSTSKKLSSTSSKASATSTKASSTSKKAPSTSKKPTSTTKKPSTTSTQAHAPSTSCKHDPGFPISLPYPLPTHTGVGALCDSCHPCPTPLACLHYIEGLEFGVCERVPRQAERGEAEPALLHGPIGRECSYLNPCPEGDACVYREFNGEYLTGVCSPE